MKINPIVPNNAIVWVYGKFPGKIGAKHVNGTADWISGVPRHRRNMVLHTRDILWNEKDKRWYTMDPHAVPIDAKKHVTLETTEKIESMLREGISRDKICEETGVSKLMIQGIQRRML